MSELQSVFLYALAGLAVVWVVFGGYELYLRFTEKCVNCIVGNKDRLRFFRGFSLAMSILALVGIIVMWILDSVFMFVFLLLAVYFFRFYFLARNRFTEYHKDTPPERYNPNTSFKKDLEETSKQFKLLIKSPRKFFSQNNSSDV